MRQAIRWLLLGILASTGCGPALPAFPSGCPDSGTIGTDRVPLPTQGFDISFHYYLPPCYDESDDARYPVIYLIAMPYESRLEANSSAPMSLADRLIRNRELGPVILIVPNDTVAYGYHAALARDLVPYVDSSFNTLADRRFRSVGGISHGGAIAARMAFEFPEEFAAVGVFSGGIADVEIERFDAWIAVTSPNELPRVLIDVGDRDSIFPLTQNLIGVLDAHDLPYTLERGAGGHTWSYWSTRIESYLRWMAQDWAH